MANDIERLAKILRTPPELLKKIDDRILAISGQKSVMPFIMEQNDIIIDRTLAGLGLSRQDYAEDVYGTLVQRLKHLDNELFDLLGKPDLSKMSMVCGLLCEKALRVFTPPRGLFIKREKVAELLEKYPPENMLTALGYTNVADLIKNEGFSSVVSALRFTQSQEWMHTFFDKAYDGLTANDFEEREVELKILDPKWFNIAEKFMTKKYHNLSHLKEYGIIFIIPLPIDLPGETIRTFTLLLHYLHEVPFYSNLFRKYMEDKDFIVKFKSLLRGDVSEDPLPGGDKFTWRVIQRYLAKDNPDDPRLFEPHVNPEADHWFRAEEDLGRLSRMIAEDGDRTGQPGLGYWAGLDFVGDFFKNRNGQEQLVSFDLIDLVMSVVEQGQSKYLYHQQEALWNKIFIEFMGRERMNSLIEDHLIDGFITV